MSIREELNTPDWYFNRNGRIVAAYESGDLIPVDEVGCAKSQAFCEGYDKGLAVGRNEVRELKAVVQEFIDSDEFDASSHSPSASGVAARARAWQRDLRERMER